MVVGVAGFGAVYIPGVLKRILYYETCTGEQVHSNTPGFMPPTAGGALLVVE